MKFLPVQNSKFSDLKHASEQINVDEIISSTNSVIMRVGNSCLTEKHVKRKGRSSLNKGAIKKRKEKSGMIILAVRPETKLSLLVKA